MGAEGDAADPPRARCACGAGGAPRRVTELRERALSRLSPRGAWLVCHYSKLTWQQLTAMVPITALQASRAARRGGGRPFWGFANRCAAKPEAFAACGEGQAAPLLLSWQWQARSIVRASARACCTRASPAHIPRAHSRPPPRAAPQVLVMAAFFRKASPTPLLEAAGLASAVVGLVLFLDGLRVAVMPMALLVGTQLPQRLALPWVLLVAFGLGVLVT
jgi:hypothetical protein